jgi:protein phosphatase
LFVHSDGLWDVISTKKAVQLVVEVKYLMTVRFSCHCSPAAVASCLPSHFTILQGKERNAGDSTSAAKVANRVLNEARNLRTKDNTSVIFVDFDILRTDLCIAK